MPIERSSIEIPGERSPPARSKEYMVWVRIRARCYSRRSPDFKYYGARGIRVCARWLNSYASFLNDMGRAPSDDHSIDRERTNGDYEPTNCRWSTDDIQAFNRRCFNKTTGHTGIRLRRGRFEARIQRSGIALYLGAYLTLEGAIEARRAAEIEHYGVSSTHYQESII
jgi:hypothetical protein